MGRTVKTTYRCFTFATVVIVIVVLVNCRSVTPTTMTTSPAASATPIPRILPTEVKEEVLSEFEGKVDVGGYEMYLHCMGTGTPTVILEYEILIGK